MGSGIFKSLESTTAVSRLPETIPESFALEQNYPNPFNATTTIQFSIPQSGHVKLTLLNILGEELTTLLNESLNAGTYKFTWDASNFSSGVYFYRLQVKLKNSKSNVIFEKTRRLTLIK
ncbi:MAG: T9SS C-terminal target domain-containing protein [Calditrichaeota bacterium]|nr:MAG: T9SS C-terminal target domain-containing protein [Calditrichota bacterium]